MNIRAILLMILALSASVSAQELTICDKSVFSMEHESAPYIVRYAFTVYITNNSSETQCVGRDLYWWNKTTPDVPYPVPLSNNWYWEWEDEIILVGPELFYLEYGEYTEYGGCINPGETIRISLYPFRPIMEQLWIEKHQEYETEKDMLLHFFQEAVLHLYHNGETYISTCERTIRYCPEHIECD